MRIVILFLAVLGLAAAALYWTRIRPHVPATALPAPAGFELPKNGTRFTVAQRSDAAVPGTDDRLRVHLGDITRKQVDISLHHDDGRVLVPTTSVRQGDRCKFILGDTRYTLSVLDLKNSLLGKDTAELEITAGLSERDRIEQLLSSMESSTLVFIRNGKEYPGAEAADHLRRKWKAAGDRVRTAEQFIEHLASRSSISGSAYRVRLADGTVMNSGTWLTGRLRASG